MNNPGDGHVDAKPLHEKLTKDHTNHDRSRFEKLCGPQARFLPEKDAEVQGWYGFLHELQDVNHTALGFDHDSTHSESPLRSYECAFCNLMWLRPVLRGQNVPEVTHPIHHTIYHSSGSTLRSLIVTIATAGPPEVDQFLEYVGIGVYFHENSALNISRSLPLTYRLRPISSSPRSISPDLAVATEALKVVRTRVVPDRKRMIKELADLYRWTDEEIRAVSRFRLIIASSSVALIEGMTCSHPRCKFGRSSRDGTSGETNAFTRLMEQVEALSKAGIQVVWYLVDRQVSRQAKSLAKGAYTRHLLTPKDKKLPRVTEEHAQEEGAPTVTEGSEDELKPTVRRSGTKRPVVNGQSNETLESLVLPEASLAAVS